MGTTRRLLLLGGTTEASALARYLAGQPGWEVTTSLAGRTAKPAAPPGGLRVGGFGGTEGLLTYLLERRVEAVIDATHPFAARMRWHAASAAGRAGIPRLRLERPPWSAQPGDRWIPVASLAAAGQAIAGGLGARVFLTVGRGELDAFTPAADGRRWWLVRSIDPPAALALRPAEVVLGRGPFVRKDEYALLRRYQIDLLVTKNSGGTAAAAKLEAARSLGVPVVIVGRPASPPGPAATTVEEAVAWLHALHE